MEDYYTYYVEMIGISEQLFWGADLSFVEQVAENKAAYTNWKAYVEERAMQRGKK